MFIFSIYVVLEFGSIVCMMFNEVEFVMLFP